MEPIITPILSGIILLAVSFLFFLLRDIKSDVRELRQNYFEALSKVGELKTEIEVLRGVINVLNAEISHLKTHIGKRK